MALRLEVFQFECQANMPTRYKRDLRCGQSNMEQGQEDEQETEQNEKENEQQEDWNIEDQEHLEKCPGNSVLWGKALDR